MTLSTSTYLDTWNGFQYDARSVVAYDILVAILRYIVPESDKEGEGERGREREKDDIVNNYVCGW